MAFGFENARSIILTRISGDVAEDNTNADYNRQLNEKLHGRPNGLLFATNFAPEERRTSDFELRCRISNLASKTRARIREYPEC